MSLIDLGLQQGMGAGNNANAAAAAAVNAQLLSQFNPIHQYMYQLQMAQALGKKSCKSLSTI